MLTVENKAPIETLPDEILLTIFNHLSPKLFFGPNNVGLICKKFFEISHDKSFASRRKILLKTCQDDLTEALTLLTNIDYFPDLKFQEILDIVSYHPELAEPIFLNNKELMMYLENDHLVILGKNHPTIAAYILNNSRLNHTLYGKHLSALAENHLPIAEFILNTPKLSTRLTINDLVNLAKNHPTIAEHILHQPELYQQIVEEGHYLATLGKNHPTIANHILNTPELSRILSKSDLVTLSKNLPHFAADIFNNDELSGRDLARLGQYHLPLAQSILNTPKLMNQFKKADLVLLGKNHFSIAKQILNAPDINRLKGNHLAVLGKKHPVIAEEILHTADLVNKLDGDDLEMLSASHLDNALYILKTPELARRLQDRNLIRMGKNDFSLAKFILATPELKDKLSTLSPIKLEYSTLIKQALTEPKNHDIAFEDLLPSRPVKEPVCDYVLTSDSIFTLIKQAFTKSPKHYSTLTSRSELIANIQNISQKKLDEKNHQNKRCIIC